MQLTSRLLTGLAALGLCSLAFATFAPVMPWQEMPMVKPTEEHKLILKGVGEWTGVMTMEMPGAPEPMVAPCSETVTAVGELWTTSKFEMDMMGMPFTGASTLGYDPDKKMVVGTWIDSMSTRLTVMEGKYDAKKDAIVMHYEMPDPMTGEMLPVRSEYKYSDDGYTIHFYNVGETDSLMMDMAMKRK